MLQESRAKGQAAEDRAEIAHRARQSHCPKLHFPVEHPLSGEGHDNFGRQGNTGAFYRHQQHNTAVTQAG